MRNVYYNGIIIWYSTTVNHCTTLQLHAISMLSKIQLTVHKKNRNLFFFRQIWHLLTLNVTDKRGRGKKFYTKCTNLQYIPINEKHIILGENWLRVEWNPSRQLVWDSGEACLIPLTREALVKAEYIFSYTGESTS